MDKTVWKFEVGDRVKPRASPHITGAEGRVYDRTEGSDANRRYRVLFDDKDIFMWISQAVLEEFYQKTPNP